MAIYDKKLKFLWNYLAKDGILSKLTARLIEVIIAAVGIWWFATSKDQTFVGRRKFVWSKISQFFSIEIPLWVVVVFLSVIIFAYLAYKRWSTGEPIDSAVSSTTFSVINPLELSKQPPAGVFDMTLSSTNTYKGYGSRNYNNEKKESYGNPGTLILVRFPSSA